VLHLSGVLFKTESHALRRKSARSKTQQLCYSTDAEMTLMMTTTDKSGKSTNHI
jgi:hypothetical protein